MTRSGERAKAVDDLTPEELLRELRRCQTLAAVYTGKVAAKALEKRLLEIEARLERSEDEP